MYSVITNCTYDGLCYNAVSAEALLEKCCDRIHFDEAWYGYARFNPMYKDHFAMRGDPAATTALRSSPPTPRTSCWRRCRRPPISTFATEKARSTTIASTKRT